MTKTEEYSLYKKTLEKYFDLNKYKIKENPVVLNIGCGTGLDIKVQKDYCKAKTILGIDINLKHIEEATRLYGQEKGFYFTADDARFLDQIVMINFDIMFCSHPEVWHRNKIWEEIFKISTKKLKKDSYMISTFYIEKEMNIAKEILEGLYYEIKTSEKNPYSLRLPESNFDKHGYILVAEKN